MDALLLHIAEEGVGLHGLRHKVCLADQVADGLGRIIFNCGPAAKTPLIAQMAMEVGVAASILGASTRSVGERAYGYILLEIPGGPDELAKAVNFLRKTPDVTVSVEVNYGENKGVEA